MVEPQGEHMRFTLTDEEREAVAALKKVIDEGRLGRIFSVQLNCFWNRRPEYYLNDPWKGTADLDGGCLYTQFSHFIDLLYWMAGDVVAAQAFADNFCHQETVDFEDAGVVVLRFPNGALGRHCVGSG